LGRGKGGGAVDADEAFADDFGGGGEGESSASAAGATMSRPAATPPAPAKKATAAPAEERSRRADPTTPEQPRGPGRWWRKVWFSVGEVSPQTGARAADGRAVLTAAKALEAAPDSRDRHRALVQALARAGQLERAAEVAESWLRRDPLDADALTFLSDVIGRQGRRDEALRLLSGIVDLAPDDRALQERLAGAYDRLGAADRACAHRVALADILATDPAVGAAVRCERALGRDDDAALLLRALSTDAARERAEKAAQVPAPVREVRGPIVLDASWTGPADVDLTLVTPQGTRLSWMGGRATVVADGAGDVGRERLGLTRAPAGSYVIEVSRARPGDGTPVSGQIRVQALGTRRTLSFTLAGDHAVVGRVDVKRMSRLEPM
jgi:Flp pilus assembly protein TadD